jgi:uncharacterized membrane protein YfcA
MTLIDFLIFVAVGCGVGFLAGLFGVGGGFIMVPILILSYEHYGFSPSVLTHIAIGTSLFVIVLISIMSAYQHNKLNNIDWRAVFLIGLSSALPAFITTGLAVKLSGKHLRVVFALVVITAAIRMLTEGKARAQKKLELSPQSNALRLIGVGITTGIISALAGIGGGIFIIPMMYYFIDMPLKLAIGTSSATIFITAFFSAGGYILNGMNKADLPQWSFGFVDFQRGIALAIGASLLVKVGAHISFKTHPYRLRKLFAFFIILISVYMLLM